MENIKKWSLISLAMVVVIAVCIYVIYFILTFHARSKQAAYHNYNINSFAGCYNKGKATWDSYDTMTEDQINDSLKMLQISKKEFEERRDKCIKARQLESFAGCKEEKNPWKRWDEMNEQEFKDTLKYFDVSEETFNNIKESCVKQNV